MDGAKLDYFTASSAGNSKRIAYLNGSAVGWRLRSPQTSGTISVWGINAAGWCSYGDASRSAGVRPAIILPSNFRISADLITYPAA